VPVAGAVFGSGGLLVTDCADVTQVNATTIPASTATRFAFHRSDNLLALNALLTGYKLEVLGATLVAFPTRGPILTHSPLPKLYSNSP